MDKQLTVHQLVPVQRVSKEDFTALVRGCCAGQQKMFCLRGFVPPVFLFGGHTFALQAEAAASFSARDFFISSFPFWTEVRWSETPLWSDTRRSCSKVLERIRHSLPGAT